MDTFPIVVALAITSKAIVLRHHHKPRSNQSNKIRSESNLGCLNRAILTLLRYVAC